MVDLTLLQDLAFVFLFGLAGAAVMLLLRQPVVVGYLLAGLAIGPHVLGLMHDVDHIEVLAELGVAFLMFVLGLEFSLKQLKSVQRVAILGGALQVTITIGLGVLIGQVAGWNTLTSVFFGCLIALSSTAVVLKLLQDRGQLDTLHGRIMIGILILQDLSVVPMMVILPAMAQPDGNIVLAFAYAGARAALLLGITFVVGTLVVPRLFYRVAATRSREVFLLTVVALAVGMAMLSNVLGLSIAFGAFLAGLLLSESPFSRQVFSEIIPLRDIFAIVFFVSVGTLIDPRFVASHAALLMVMVLAIAVGKTVITGSVTRAFGYSGAVAVTVGIGLSQIGEFSFVLARIGVTQGLIPADVYPLTLAAALITILITPLALQSAPRASRALAMVPFLGQFAGSRVQVHLPEGSPGLTNHVVICGFGAVGSRLFQALSARGFKSFIIELDPRVIFDLRSKGVPCVYGDAANPQVLEATSLRRARVLAVTVSDVMQSETIVENARRLNPRLDVIVRAHKDADLGFLRRAGAREVVQPEFEAGLEMIRHTIQRFGVSSAEIQLSLNRMREQHYQAQQEAID